MLSPLPRQKWNYETAAHLLNRAAFGGTPAEIKRVQEKGLEASIGDLLDVPDDVANVMPPSWARPRDIRGRFVKVRSLRSDPGQSEKLEEMHMSEGADILDLRRWWLELMITTPAPLLEKMTLFWHGHFATSIQKTRDGYWMWLQNDTLRRNALGNFRTLTKKMSRDPAMMIYLDLGQNRMEHPNENWARELMELFTVGIGNYTEQDVRESARAFTGYRINLANQQFRFAGPQHDPGLKTFMGRTGSLGGDDIIDTLLEKPACAQFIGRKIWRYFVEEEPPPGIVDAVASNIRSHNYEIRPVLREIFGSREFYSGRAIRSQIKSPIQFLVQTCKLLEAPFPSAAAAQAAMPQLGQILFAPPNVKGWDGGKAWITTSTLLFRYNFANYLINGDRMRPVARIPNGADPGFRRDVTLRTELRRDPIDISKLIPKDLRKKPKRLVAYLSNRFFQTQLEEKEAADFIEYLEVRKPDTSDATMRALVHLMMSTPQFQLT